MAITSTMVDSLNALIFAGKRVTIEVVAERLSISVCTVLKIVHDDLVFSKVNSRSVLKGHYIVKIISQLGTAARSSLQSRSGPLWFLIVKPPAKNFCVEQSFQLMMKGRAPWANGERLGLKISKRKEYQSLFFDGKMCFKEWRLY